MRLTTYARALLLGLTLSVTPRLQFEPAKLTITYKSDVGDTIVVIIDSENFYRRSDKPNTGRTAQMTWPGVPGGQHTIVAIAFDHGREVARKTTMVEIASRQ